MLIRESETVVNQRHKNFLEVFSAKDLITPQTGELKAVKHVRHREYSQTNHENQ
jgi:hypothetical protein